MRVRAEFRAELAGRERDSGVSGVFEFVVFDYLPTTREEGGPACWRK